MKQLLQTKKTICLSHGSFRCKWWPLYGRRPQAAVLRSNWQKKKKQLARTLVQPPSKFHLLLPNTSDFSPNGHVEWIQEDFASVLTILPGHHHTRPGLNSAPLSSALTRSWKFPTTLFFVFNTVFEFNKKKPLQNIREKKHQNSLYLTHFPTNTVWQEEKCHG